MGDEEVGEAELLLKLLQQVDDLSLDRDVEGRHRFVGDDQLGAHGEGAGDADALTLAPGELMRVAPEVLGGEAHRLEQLYDALLALATASGELVDDERLADDRSHRHPRVQGGVGVLEDDLHLLADLAERPLVEGGDVPILEPDFARGGLDEAEDGPAGRGLAAARFPDEPLSSVVTFLSWNHTSPAVGSMSRRMLRPVVDLPHPDSPTRPSVSPAMMSNETSSTAWTRATSRENSPPRIGKYFFRCRTRRSASAIGA